MHTRFAHPPDDEAAGHVRARPDTVLVEERYRVRQEISRNPDVSLESGAAGKVEISLPYDGHRYFTRDALADLPHRTDHRSERNAPAGIGVEPTRLRIGHLLVADHRGTDLARTTGRSGRTIALPLLIPSPPEGAEPTADRLRFRQEITYHPDPGRPKLVPVQLQVEVNDPGTAKAPAPEEDWAGPGEDMTFRPYLELEIRVWVNLPGRKGWTPPPPVIRRINLSLPSGSGLALSSAEVLIGDQTTEAGTVQLDPDDGGVEWFDVPTVRATAQKVEGVETFVSPQMFLRIHQPGELFSEPELLVRAHVETDEILLSGSLVRLFDARGQRVRGPNNPLTVRSSVHVTASVVLDDAFAKRMFNLVHTFHFDEVVPGSGRLADIKTALTDLRFEVEDPVSIGTPPDKSKKAGKLDRSRQSVDLITARRGEDEDAVELMLLVVGSHQETQRRSQHPGGRRFTSTLPTGDLTLIVHGRAPRDSRQLVHDVNALQLQLRERFRRMKAQR